MGTSADGRANRMTREQKDLLRCILNLPHKGIEKKLKFDTLQYWADVVNSSHFYASTTAPHVEYTLKLVYNLSAVVY